MPRNVETEIYFAIEAVLDRFRMAKVPEVTIASALGRAMRSSLAIECVSKRFAAGSTGEA